MRIYKEFYPTEELVNVSEQSFIKNKITDAEIDTESYFTSFERINVEKPMRC